MTITPANGDRRLKASGAIGTLLGLAVALGHLWGWDALSWWDRAVESVILVDGTLGALGLWAKAANYMKAHAAAAAIGAVAAEEADAESGA